ncbi:MAG: substrate-binding domain-containing protein, partial [Oscillospiraceae bacterium]|nr:substrate-binding domain-containing protein [Oscillospiraceae bacterium]
QDNDVNLLISTHQSPEIYEHVQNRQIDCGLVLAKLRYPNINIEPLFSEKMVMVSKTHYGAELIEPTHVDFSREVLLNWGYEFLLWHNSWCDPRIQPMLQVDTVAMLLHYLNIEQSWATLPESVALALEKTDGLHVYDFKDPPPHRFVYLINHINARPGNIETIKLFQSEIKKYVSMYMHE